MIAAILRGVLAGLTAAFVSDKLASRSRNVQPVATPVEYRVVL